MPLAYMSKRCTVASVCGAKNIKCMVPCQESMFISKLHVYKDGSLFPGDGKVKPRKVFLTHRLFLLELPLLELYMVYMYPVWYPCQNYNMVS